VVAKPERNFVYLNVAILRRGYDELMLGSQPVFAIKVPWGFFQKIRNMDENIAYKDHH
jgi:hypothetical protein